jgi:hypothetical protein
MAICKTGVWPTPVTFLPNQDFSSTWGGSAWGVQSCARDLPTFLNAWFHVAQFWDGRAMDLAAQAKRPVLNPVEMAMPDDFYDGKIRVTGPDGTEHAKYDPVDYRQYVAERVEPWSYLKFPYLKKIGWKGFVDGKDSGVYKATHCPA